MVGRRFLQWFSLQPPDLHSAARFAFSHSIYLQPPQFTPSTTQATAAPQAPAAAQQAPPPPPPAQEETTASGAAATSQPGSTATRVVEADRRTFSQWICVQPVDLFPFSRPIYRQLPDLPTATRFTFSHPPTPARPTVKFCLRPLHVHPTGKFWVSCSGGRRQNFTLHF